MHKKISFVILGSSGAPAKQVSASKTSIYVFTVALIALFAGLGYIVYDYYNLRDTTSHLQNREIYLSSQLEEIQNQRKQIQDFANEINSLKAKLVAINSFEKKIRIIANIEKSSDADNIFGVGGSIPEDLDARIPLKEKHNSLMRDMHEQIEQLSMATANQQIELESLEDQQNLLASTPTIRPVSRKVNSWVTSRFGYRISPFTKRREFHKGYDIASRQGTPIMATADGVVTYAGKKGLYGNFMVIDHGHGIITRYGHCYKLLKKKGDKVKRWDTIALMGNTGRSTGPHLHYEVHMDGIPVNPVKYILN